MTLDGNAVRSVDPAEVSPGEFDSILIRTSLPLTPMSGAIKAAVESIDPRIAFHFHDLQEQIRYAIRQERLMALLCGFFAALAALLAAVGVYGVMAYAAAQRTSEIGVRLALGAGRASILRMLLRDALVVLVAGLGVGVVVARLVARAAASLLFGLEPTDASAFAVAIALLSLAVGVASYVPARRASRLDPMVALRAE